MRSNTCRICLQACSQGAASAVDRLKSASTQNQFELAVHTLIQFRQTLAIEGVPRAGAPLAASTAASNRTRRSPDRTAGVSRRRIPPRSRQTLAFSCRPAPPFPLRLSQFRRTTACAFPKYSPPPIQSARAGAARQPHGTTAAHPASSGLPPPLALSLTARH
jgi:hypothetical protein